MFIQLLAISTIWIGIALIGRWLIDTHGKDNELLRKLVHVLHGSGLAALAFVLPLILIVGIEIVFLVSVIIARYLTGHFTKVPWISYMNRMYSVGRLSFGEFFFPISAIALVFLADSKWEFAAAILILGVSDALAAIVGKKYGKNSGYLVFGQKKSVVGSIAFFCSALIIVTGFAVVTGISFTISTTLLVLVTTLLVTITENLGVYGSDNLLIPLVAVVLLNRL